MRLKFLETCKYKQVIKEEDIVSGKYDKKLRGQIDPESPIYLAGKEYEVSEDDGYARRWLRRGVAEIVARRPTAPSEVKGKS